MGSKTFLPLAVLSGLANCYASPTTANVTTLTVPVQQGLPFHDDVPAMPEQDHGPHSGDDPGDGLILTNYDAASGNLTNTSASMITDTASCVLPTSPSMYEREGVRAHRRVGVTTRTRHERG